MKRLISFTVATGLLFSVLALAASGQAKTRIICDTGSPEKAPVVIASRQVGSEFFDASNSIRAEKGWLDQLALNVKNVSVKNITFFEIDVRVPRTGKMVKTGMVFTIRFGDRNAPAAADYKGTRTMPDLLVPGSVVSVRIDDSTRAWLRNYLETHEAQDLDVIEVSIREVHFADGTGWNRGIELRQDPLVPKNWIPIIDGENRISGLKDTKKKTITKGVFTNPSMEEPVEILEMRSNGKVVKLDESFTDDDWFKDFSIKFKNVSDRPITHLNWNILFPETGSAGEPYGFPTTYTMTYGLTRAAERQGAEGAKSLMPGETEEIRLDSKGFAKLRELVGKRMDLRDTTTARLTLLLAYFPDGSQWSTGDLWRPDPLRPGKFIVVRDNQ